MNRAKRFREYLVLFLGMGIMLGPRIALAHPLSKYSVTIEDMRIRNTRAVDEDTDYLGVSGWVNQAQKDSTSKRIGDVDNGTHNLGTTLRPFVVGRGGSTLSFDYIVYNKGTGSPNQVMSALAGVAAAGLYFAGPTGAGIGGGIVAAEKLVEALFPGFASGACDGPVASDLVSLPGAELERLTRNGATIRRSKDHPGSESPVGCGSNSSYSIDWQIRRTFPGPRMSAPTNSGFYLQSNFGNQGNFEMAVSRPDAGFDFAWRNNDVNPHVSGATPVWSTRDQIGAGSGKIDGLSMIQSNFNFGNPDAPSGPDPAGVLEVVARQGDQLSHFWRDDVPPYTWHGPLALPAILPSGHAHFAGNPSLIQSTFGSKGNFELVVPLADRGMAFYWRDNDNRDLVWNGPFAFGEAVGHVEAVSLVQSNLGETGNLELVARTAQGLQYFWRTDKEPRPWIGTGLIHDSQNTTGIPSMIQSTYGQRGNFELAVPLLTGGIAFFWRDNDNTAFPWNGPDVMATDLGRVESVSLMQSNYGDQGNLELLAKTPDGRVWFYWREGAPSFQWHGPMAGPI